MIINYLDTIFIRLFPWKNEKFKQLRMKHIFLLEFISNLRWAQWQWVCFNDDHKAETSRMYNSENG